MPRAVYGTFYASTYGAPAGYPSGDLDATAELLLGETWTDVTKQAMPDGAQYADITGGQDDGAQQSSPMQLAAAWDNPDGKFSPRNAGSPWFGQIRQNTPARVSVASPYGSYLRLEADSNDRAFVDESPALDITGSIEMRLQLRLSDWRQCVLAAKWDGSPASWMWILNGDGTMTFNWNDSGGVFHTATSTAPVSDLTATTALRVTMNAATGGTAFYTGTVIGGPFTQLGPTVQPTGGAATSVKSGSGGVAPLVVGWSVNLAGQMRGAVDEFRLYNGLASGGTVAADAVFTAQAAGATSWTDSAGNLWKLAGGAEISDRDYRLHGELSQLQPSVDTSGSLPQVATQVSGLLRRLQQGDAPPVDSPMKRAIATQSGAAAPVAYWTFEDSPGSTSLGSGVGGPAMQFDGPLQLASDSSFIASAPLPLLNGARLRGKVPKYPGNGTAVTVRWLAKIGTVPSGAGASAPLVRAVCTGGSCALVVLRVYNGGGLGLAGFKTDGTIVFDTGGVAWGGGTIGQPLWYSIDITPVAGGQKYAIVTIAPGASSGSAFSTTVAGGVHGQVTAVEVNNSAFFTDTVFGHLSAQSAWVDMFTLGSPLNAWTGELAADRFSRLCAEQGLTTRIYGSPARSAAMGPQTIDTAMNLLQDCAGADQGLIYEPRETVGIGYRTLASMLNQAPAVTLDYALANHPGSLQPSDDDLDLVNDITVSRPDGSSFRAVLDDGSPLSVSDPKDGGAGRYASTAQANVQTDGELTDAAGWRLRQGTVDEARFRQVTADFGIPAAAPLAAALARVRQGDVVAVANPPAVIQTDDIRQLVTGAEETLGPGRKITWSCVPASAYDVAVYDDTVRGRADTAGCQVRLAATAAATTLAVASAGVPWTTDPGHLPFDLNVAGERVTVTAVGSGPSGSATSPAAFHQIANISLPPGTWLIGWTVQLSGTPGSSDANNFQVATAPGGTTQATSANAGAAGTYVQRPVLVTIDGVTSTGIMIRSGTGAATPGAVYAATITSPQALTVTRSVNGVSRSHAAGDPVRLWTTPRYAPI